MPELEKHDKEHLHLSAVHALDAATAAADRAFEAVAERVLAMEGPAAQLEAALARGVPHDAALNRAISFGRGRLAEVKHAINFNRDAGLVASPLTAIRNPDSRHPQAVGLRGSEEGG